MMLGVLSTMAAFGNKMVLFHKKILPTLQIFNFVHCRLCRQTSQIGTLLAGLAHLCVLFILQPACTTSSSSASFDSGDDGEHNGVSFVVISEMIQDIFLFCSLQ